MFKESIKKIGFPGVADFPTFPEGRGQSAEPHVGEATQMRDALPQPA